MTTVVFAPSLMAILVTVLNTAAVIALGAAAVWLFRRSRKSS